MARKIISEVKKQMLAFVTMAFSFVAALMWREAFLEILKPIINVRNGAVTYTFVALVVTIVAVLLIVVLARFLGEKED